MKESNRQPAKSDKLGENTNIRTGNIGLSTPEAEEAGDFEDSVETGDSEKKSPKREKSHIVEGKGSTGHVMYEPDYKDIETGTTGTNAKKDRNAEKSGSKEADVWPDESENATL